MKAFRLRLMTQVLPFLLLVPAMGYAQPMQGPSPAEAAAAANPGAPVTYTQAQIDQMLAPIALYPDQLLMQVLMAATFPQQVIDAGKWVQDPANAGRKGDDLAAALEPLPWDPSVKSLVAVPQIIVMMNTHLDWTQALGVAFAGQQVATMARVQFLRERAASAGHLRTTRQIRIVHRGPSIVIEPADPRMIYVPVYNPAVVYGRWSDRNYPPVYLPPPPQYVDPGFVVGAGIGFGVGFGVVAPLSDWGHPDWRRHEVVIDHNRFDRITNTTQFTTNNIVIQNNTWHRTAPVVTVAVPAASRPAPAANAPHPPGTATSAAVQAPPPNPSPTPPAAARPANGAPGQPVTPPAPAAHPVPTPGQPAAAGAHPGEPAHPTPPTGPTPPAAAAHPGEPAHPTPPTGADPASGGRTSGRTGTPDPANGADPASGGRTSGRAGAPDPANGADPASGGRTSGRAGTPDPDPTRSSASDSAASGSASRAAAPRSTTGSSASRPATGCTASRSAAGGSASRAAAPCSAPSSGASRSATGGSASRAVAPRSATGGSAPAAAASRGPGKARGKETIIDVRRVPVSLNPACRSRKTS